MDHLRSLLSRFLMNSLVDACSTFCLVDILEAFLWFFVMGSVVFFFLFPVSEISSILPIFFPNLELFEQFFTFWILHRYCNFTLCKWKISSDIIYWWDMSYLLIVFGDIVDQRNNITDHKISFGFERSCALFRCHLLRLWSTTRYGKHSNYNLRILWFD